MFHKVLVANRGEIALRVVRALRELGVRSVVAHSTADADSLPARLADESVCIGPPPARESYLNIPALVSAAEVTNSDAIHPGYGFLAENANFAEVCRNCGIKFIGPPAEVIAHMGNKIRAREEALRADVPVLPGSPAEIADEAAGLKVAAEVGYPVMLKAAAGGGGRGMKVVYTSASFGPGFQTARAEALAAFGDPTLYIEKFFERARHIEIQILADEHGTVLHLGERDCSIQRRHQKILEESPSTAVPPKLRERMGETAVRLASRIGYANAGTVEFLFDEGTDKFYFLEMNTRIQVEHPVTEWRTGMDLVRDQIRIAAGERLTLRQRDVPLRGHAMECRINAEDPVTFAPRPGKVTALVMPGGLGVRVDTALAPGTVVGPDYDSLVAKVSVYGDNRREAIQRMKGALGEFVIEGLPTNLPLHQRILEDAEFIEGKVHTRFLEKFQ